MRGKLLYFLSVEDFSSFVQEYRDDGRGVTEQVLNLSCSEKERIWQFLQTNYLPQNRFYKYDFIFDNCSTRIRDIFSTSFGDHWKTSAILPRKDLSFRQIINSYLSGSPWEKLGINLLFGMPTDAPMTDWNIMFLPDFLMKGMGSASLDGKPFVSRTASLIPAVNPPGRSPFRFTPLLLFILVCGPLLLLSFSGNRRTMQLLQWTDRFLFFLAGLLGCFMLFMWLGTDHRVCRWNWNLLWALPAHLVFSLFMDRATRWTKWYAAASFVLDILLILGWYLLPQQLPPAVIPVILLLLVRSYRIYQRLLPSVSGA